MIALSQTTLHTVCTVRQPKVPFAGNVGRKSISSNVYKAKPSRVVTQAKRADAKDEEEIARMQKQAEAGDIWESDALSTVVKVLVVALVGATVAGIVTIAQPVIQQTIAAFPQA